MTISWWYLLASSACFWSKVEWEGRARSLQDKPSLAIEGWCINLAGSYITLVHMQICICPNPACCRAKKSANWVSRKVLVAEAEKDDGCSLARALYGRGMLCRPQHSTHIPVCHPSWPTSQISLSTAAHKLCFTPQQPTAFHHVKLIFQQRRHPRKTHSLALAAAAVCHLWPTWAQSGQKRRSIDKKYGSRDLQRWGQSADVCLLLKMEAAGAKYFTACGLKRKDGKIYPIYSVLLKLGMLKFFWIFKILKFVLKNF